MTGAAVMVDYFEDIIDVVMYCNHTVELCFHGRGGQFVVVVDVYGVWNKVIETSVGEEFLSSGSCSNVGKFCKRQTYSLVVLPIVAVDAGVLLQYLDCLFTESICLQLVGNGRVQVDIEFLVQLCEEL